MGRGKIPMSWKMEEYRNSRAEAQREKSRNKTEKKPRFRKRALERDGSEERQGQSPKEGSFRRRPLQEPISGPRRGFVR